MIQTVTAGGWAKRKKRGSAKRPSYSVDFKEKWRLNYTNI